MSVLIEAFVFTVLCISVGSGITTLMEVFL
jgi:hypothetical protein